MADLYDLQYEILKNAIFKNVQEINENFMQNVKIMIEHNLPAGITYEVSLINIYEKPSILIIWKGELGSSDIKSCIITKTYEMRYFLLGKDFNIIEGKNTEFDNFGYPFLYYVVELEEDDTELNYYPRQLEFNEIIKLIEKSMFVEEIIIKLYLKYLKQIEESILVWYGKKGLREVLIPIIYGAISYFLHEPHKPHSPATQKLRNYIYIKVCQNENEKVNFNYIYYLFVEIMNGKDVKGEWSLPIIEQDKNNPFLKIVLLMGDILLYKELINDYDKEVAKVILPYETNWEFNKIMQIDVMTKLINCYDEIESLKKDNVIIQLAQNR